MIGRVAGWWMDVAQSAKRNARMDEGGTDDDEDEEDDAETEEEEEPEDGTEEVGTEEE